MSDSTRDGPAFTKATLLNQALAPSLFTHRFYASAEPTGIEEERLKTKVFNLDSPSKVYERDMLVSFGAPLIYASLCAIHGSAIPSDMGILFANCSCQWHEWFLGALHPDESGSGNSGVAGSRDAHFLVACGGLLYLVKAVICEATGSMTIAGVLDQNSCTLPRLMAPCGKFVASMMDLNLYHWDFRNKGKIGIGLIEHLEAKAESPFSDSDASDDSSVREVPQESVSAKKRPGSPFPETGPALDSSDDSDYEVEGCASLNHLPARKLPARESRPAGSFAEV